MFVPDATLGAVYKGSTGICSRAVGTRPYDSGGLLGELISFSFPIALHQSRWRIKHRALSEAWKGSGARFSPVLMHREDSTHQSGRSGIPASIEIVHGSSLPPTHIGCLEFSLLVSVFRKLVDYLLPTRRLRLDCFICVPSLCV